MHVSSIPCLTDNYAYIINDNVSKTVGVVDPSEASPIITYLKKQNLKLDYILNTHHHYDHIGGNIELKKLYNAKVIGFVGDKHRIPGIDITLEDNVKWIFGNHQLKYYIFLDILWGTYVSSLKMKKLPLLVIHCFL